jgi:hypothetical protein
MTSSFLNRRARGVVVALALCMLSGSIRAQQAELAPQPGRASIVVFRAAREPLLSAHNVAYPIAFDEQWISNLPKAKYFVFPAWPGTHRIALALRLQHLPSYASEREGSSGLDLDVKAGETYYIKANPGAFRLGPDAFSRVGTAALELMSREAAQEDFASSTPVDWLKELQEGTLAEVRTLAPPAEEPSAACAGGVEWIPDKDSVQTSNFKRMSILNGTVFLGSDALALHLKSTEPVGTVIPYTEIAAAEIRNKGLKRIVLIRRKNGHLDSFSVLTAGGGRVDRERTKVCGEALASKLGG